MLRAYLYLSTLCLWAPVTVKHLLLFLSFNLFNLNVTKIRQLVRNNIDVLHTKQTMKKWGATGMKFSPD